MHAVEDGEWEANVHNSSPQVELVEFCFSVVVKLGTCTECWHDPKLPSKDMGKTTEVTYEANFYCKCVFFILDPSGHKQGRRETRLRYWNAGMDI